MSKRSFFEYYRGKYCKLASDLVPEEQYPDAKFLHWLVYHPVLKKYLQIKPTNPTYLGFVFGADKHNDKDVLKLVPGSTLLYFMADKSDEEDREYATMTDLKDCQLVPYFKEILWMNVDGEKVMSDQREPEGEFTIAALDHPPKYIPKGSLWMGYYLGSQKVDGKTAFLEGMAGGNIRSEYKSKVNVCGYFVLDGQPELYLKRLVNPGSNITIEPTPPSGYKITKITTDLAGENPIQPDNIDVGDLDVDIYFHLDPYLSISIVSLPMADTKTLTVLRGSAIVEAPKMPAIDGYEFDDFYLDEDCNTSVSFPLVPDDSMIIYAKYHRPRLAKVVSQGRVIVFNYNHKEDAYISHDIAYIDHLVGCKVMDTDGKLKIVVPKTIEGRLTLTVSPSMIFGDALEAFNLIIAPTLTWRIHKVHEASGMAVNNAQDVIINIDYDTVQRRYYAYTDIDDQVHTDLVEVSAGKGLASRVYADPRGLNKPTNPIVVGNEITAYYDYDNPNMTLPDGYILMKRVPEMHVHVKDMNLVELERLGVSKEDISKIVKVPEYWTVETDGDFCISSDKFSKMNIPKEYGVTSVSYIDPLTKIEYRVLANDIMMVRWSYGLKLHWGESLKATLVIDETDPSKDIIIQDGSTKLLTFYVPKVEEKREDGRRLIGWYGLPSVGSRVEIATSTRYLPIYARRGTDDLFEKEV